MCARTPTRIEPQRSFKMAAPRGRPMVDYRRVRRYWDVPRHLWHGPRALNRAARSAEHAQPLPQTHHTVRIELGICASSANRVKQINVARLSLGRVCSRRAGLPRSARHCTALHWQAAPATWARQPMLPNPAAPPHHQDFTPEQAASGRATERRVACRRLFESGSNGGLVWPFGISRAAMPSGETRGQPTSLRRSCGCASRPCLAWVGATTL